MEQSIVCKAELVHLPELVITNKKLHQTLEFKKRDALFELNWKFKRMNQLLSNLDELKQELKDTYQETDQVLKEIEEHVGILNSENEMFHIKESINTLNDLIFIAKKYGSAIDKNKFTINVSILNKLIDPLEKLKNMIGLDDIKDQIIDQIIASMQNFYEDDVSFHTVIKGPPGVGKTMLAKIIGQIYLKMGIIKNDKLNFKIAKRSDLIGKYLGHTALKTQNFIDKCKDGVMFIDEVYSLGNRQKKDSFSKECIDTINQNLMEQKNFICIIAGYSKEIDECFFGYNPGLKRRFPFVYKIKGYEPIELRKIFICKIECSKWSICEKLKKDPTIIDKFITEHKEYFKNYGGDIDTLILNCKIVHGRRIFGKAESKKKILTMCDIKNGFEKMLKSKDKKENFKKMSHMYC